MVIYMPLTVTIIITEVRYTDPKIHNECTKVPEISLTYKSPKEQQECNIPIVFNNKGAECFHLNNMDLNSQQVQTYLRAVGLVNHYLDSLRSCYINIFWVEVFAKLSCIKEMVYGSLSIVQCLAELNPYMLDYCKADFSLILDLDQEKPELLYDNLISDTVYNVAPNDMNDTVFEPNNIYY